MIVLNIGGKWVKMLKISNDCIGGYYVFYKWMYLNYDICSYYANISLRKFNSMIRENNGKIIKEYRYPNTYYYHIFENKEDCQKFKDELEALIMMNKIVDE